MVFTSTPNKKLLEEKNAEMQKVRKTGKLVSELAAVEKGKKWKSKESPKKKPRVESKTSQHESVHEQSLKKRTSRGSSCFQRQYQQI
jgi:D-mannonate dehydratase